MVFKMVKGLFLKQVFFNIIFFFSLTMSNDTYGQNSISSNYSKEVVELFGYQITNRKQLKFILNAASELSMIKIASVSIKQTDDGEKYFFEGLKFSKGIFNKFSCGLICQEWIMKRNFIALNIRFFDIQPSEVFYVSKKLWVPYSGIVKARCNCYEKDILFHDFIGSVVGEGDSVSDAKFDAKSKCGTGRDFLSQGDIVFTRCSYDPSIQYTNPKIINSIYSQDSTSYDNITKSVYSQDIIPLYGYQIIDTHQLNLILDTVLSFPKSIRIGTVIDKGLERDYRYYFESLLVHRKEDSHEYFCNEVCLKYLARKSKFIVVDTPLSFSDLKHDFYYDQIFYMPEELWMGKK